MADRKTTLYKFWSNQIESAKNREDSWRTEGDNIVDIYEAEKKQRFNILWSNTEILKAATLSRVAQPNVTRRYSDEQPVAREAAEIMERCLEFQSDEEIFVRNLRHARDDMLLPGRGVIWVEYESDIEDIQLHKFTNEEQVTTFMLGSLEIKPHFERDGEGFIQQIADQRVIPQYVYWKDFLQSNSRNEETVWWKARRHGLSKKEILDQLNLSQERLDEIKFEERTDDKGECVYEVWEIWSKPRRKRVWFTVDAQDIIKEEDAPLNLSGFFPCPKPLFPFESTKSMVPVPEYKIYQSLAEELNDIEERLLSLTKMAKVAGINKGMKIDIASLSDGEFAPAAKELDIDNNKSLRDQFLFIPLAEIAAVIDKLEQRKVILKGEIFEITGISDVIRGDTNASETASAQRLKGSFGSLRLRPRREPVEELIRDVYNIMGEIIAEKFTQRMITMMSGKAVPDTVMELFRANDLRQFRIDIETDSTVQPNQEIDKRKAVEFSQAIAQLFSQAIPAIQAFPQTAPLFTKTIKFVAREFKAGRQLEDEINKLSEQLQQAASQPQEQQPTEAQVKAGMEQQKIIADLTKTRETNQSKERIAQLDAQTEVIKAASTSQDIKVKAQADIVKNQLDVLASR